ncbi:uncharacterized protein LOC129609162 [Condylostylus longicornis]|uniref:uncharacterized protein LOC129609162 n=1 Tax=Condylostylus longicornis TaxID=2530218 RepID=UPI00244E4666|nr:uncharacterized protein LOC129609162 [Condylostylus longicornis]
MTNIRLRIAIESDRDAILKLLRSSFYPYEPTTLGLEPFQQTEEDEQFLLSWINYGTCIIAYYDDYDVYYNHKKQESYTKIYGNNNEDFKMNFLNHEARNQHNKEYHYNKHEMQKQQQIKGQNIKCNSNQRNQYDCSADDNDNSYHHHQNTNIIEEQQQKQTNTLNVNQILNQNIFTKELVGVLIGGPKYPGEAKHLLDESNSVKNLTWSKMLKFLSYIEFRSNVFEYFNCQSVIHCHAIAVHQNARGKSIGIKMIKEFIKICKNLKYPVITLDCTSVYSIKLCEKLNMVCLYEMEYTDYIDEHGEQILRPPLPHKLIKCFGKRTDDDDINNENDIKIF